MNSRTFARWQTWYHYNYVIDTITNNIKCSTATLALLWGEREVLSIFADGACTPFPVSLLSLFSTAYQKKAIFPKPDVKMLFHCFSLYSLPLKHTFHRFLQASAKISRKKRWSQVKSCFLKCTPHSNESQVPSPRVLWPDGLPVQYETWILMWTP